MMTVPTDIIETKLEEDEELYIGEEEEEGSTGGVGMSSFCFITHVCVYLILLSHEYIHYTIVCVHHHYSPLSRNIYLYSISSLLYILSRIYGGRR